MAEIDPRGKDEDIRLMSFSDPKQPWPSQEIVAKEDLAKNGFVYIGNGVGDEVYCVFCKQVVQDWKQDDKAEDRHKAASPACPLLTSEDHGNIPISTQSENQTQNN